MNYTIESVSDDANGPPEFWFTQGPHRFQIFVTDLFRTLGEVVWRTTSVSRAAFVRENGVAVPDGMPDEKVMPVAKSFIQLAWYRHVKGAVPENVSLNHEKRLADFAVQVVRLAARPALVFRLVKTSRSARYYRAVPGGDAAGLRGQRKVTYETLAALSPTGVMVGFEEVLAAAVARGFTCRSADGGRFALNHHLKHLVAAGLAEQGPAQAELPSPKVEETA